MKLRVQAGFRRSTDGYREDIGGGDDRDTIASFYLKVFTPSFTLVVAEIVIPYVSFYLKVLTPYSFTLVVAVIS